MGLGPVPHFCTATRYICHHNSNQSTNNSCTRHISGIMNMNNYYFYVAPDEEDLGWKFTISDLIEDEFEERPDNFPTKAAKIEFLKELIADIGECIEKVEREKEIVV